MLGLSYGELFLLLGATATLVGTKDLPMIARTAGRLAGRAVGYVQVARGQFDNVMQQSQARQVHKELQDTMAQLEAIRYEIRSISLLNPGPVTRRLVDNLDNTSATNATGGGEIGEVDNVSKATVSIEQTSAETISAAMPSQSSGTEVSYSTAMHSQATAFSRLAELSAQKAGSLQNGSDTAVLSDDVGNLNVLPICAESAGFLPNRKADVNGSDIVLEAILEAEVAQKAKDFFARPENQIEDQIKDA